MKRTWDSRIKGSLNGSKSHDFIGTPDDVKERQKGQPEGKKRIVGPKLGPENKRMGVEFSFEEQLAQKLLHRINVKCARNSWFRYDGGIWNAIDVSELLADALDVQEKTKRSILIAKRILEHVKARCQIVSTTFSSAVRFENEEDKTILINAANKIVRFDIESGEFTLKDHSPDYYFTSKLKAKYEPEALCPFFKQTLRECLPDGLDREAFLSYFGTIFIPDGRFETTLALIGSGSDGKSTLVVDGIANMVGDATSSLTLEEICEQNSHMVHLLLPSILNIGSELNGGKIESSANFKRVSSAEPIMGNPKHKEPFVFRPNTKLCFLANNSPSFSRGSDAESRRLLFIHFTRQFLDEKRDVFRKKKLKMEQDGIFMLLLKWLVKVIKLDKLPNGGVNSQGLAEEFAVRNNFVKEFVQRRCIFGDQKLRTPRSDMEREIKEFAKDYPYEIRALNQFSRKLYQLYPHIREWSRDARRRVGVGQQYLYVGIGLKSAQTSHSNEGKNERI